MKESSFFSPGFGERWSHKTTLEMLGTGKIETARLDQYRIRHTEGAETYFIPLPEGSNTRGIAVEVRGPETGRPVIRFGGSPGSRLVDTVMKEVEVDGIREKKIVSHYDYDAANVRTFTYDRPGYGESPPPLPGRKQLPVDSIEHVKAIIDFFGLENVGLVAGSGGCPHALTCANAMNEVQRVILGGPSIPFGILPEAKHFHGMHESNVRTQTLLRAGDMAGFYTNVEAMRARIREGDFIKQELGTAPEYVDYDNTPPIALIEGVRYAKTGWIQDIKAKQGWGIDFADIDVSDKEVIALIGEKDVFTPLQHGLWLAHNIPGINAYILQEGTHAEVSHYDLEWRMQWATGQRHDRPDSHSDRIKRVAVSQAQ